MSDDPGPPEPPTPSALHEDDAPERPPRGVHQMAIVRWLILALSVFVAAASWYSYAAAEGKTDQSVLYQCPMHPEIVSDRPGECPICHMTLEKVAADRTAGPSSAASTAPSPAPAPAASVQAKPGQYTCPMHPEVVSDKPGSCPKCKMDLVRVEAKGAPTSPPNGTTEVGLTLDRVQSIGVRTTKVETMSTEGAIRAPAIVEAPEQTAARVHVRAAGFVEAIAVNQTGVRVKPGQVLFSIYSPEIYQAQSELLATQNWPVPDHTGESRDVGARRKLELLGAPSGLADQVLEKKQPSRTIPIVAPAGGYVTQKNVTLGSFVTPEMTLYEIVDLSKVYVVADLFQADAAAVRVGTQATVKLRAQAPEEATVDLIYPQVNVTSRTTRIRMTLKNKSLALVPGQYGIAEFASGSGVQSVVVPADALIDTGTQQYVFVERSPGHYSPRLVHVAGEVEGGFELRGGVESGETVVSGAAFLIDSESRLRASIARSTSVSATPAPAGSTPAPAGNAPAPAEHRH